MPLDDDARAVIAKMTADLVSSYCRRLEIGPADLPGLIAYVGDVLARSAEKAEQDVLRCARDDPPRPIVPGLAETPIIVRPEAVVIDLEAYRARR